MNAFQAASASTCIPWTPGFIPFLSDALIERSALGILARYNQDFGAITQPPVPIDNIAELLLELVVEIADLGNVAGSGGGSRSAKILGLIDIETGTIRIDQDLADSTQRGRAQRYNFTLAHEIGHWCLHRELVLHNIRVLEARHRIQCRQGSAIVCRSGDGGRHELQANRFASNLLMPRDLVVQAFLQRWLETLDPQKFWRLQGMANPCFEATLPAPDRRFQDVSLSRPFQVSLRWIDGLASRFKVSCQAMEIRLTTLGLIRELP